MTLVAGVCEALLSRLLPRLKAVFPPEVCGVVITMVGFSLIRVALLDFVGQSGADHITEPRELLVSALTLSCLVGLSVWGRGSLRLYCLLISLLVGYLASLATGLLGPPTLETLVREPWFALPRLAHPGWKFSAAMLLPFLITALAAAMKAMGLILTLQGINFPEQKTPDIKNVSRGVLADALGAVTAGLLGAIGTTVSPTSVSLNTATGATSRRIAFVAAGMVFLVALLPKLVAFICAIPSPVMGAVLVYAVCIISFSGLQLIIAAKHGTHTIYLIGLSLLAGLGAEIIPQIYEELPHWAALAFHSPITVTAVVAIGLNLLFRIGGQTVRG